MMMLDVCIVEVHVLMLGRGGEQRQQVFEVCVCTLLKYVGYPVVFGLIYMFI